MKFEKSIKLNMVLNALRGVMSIIFPLISFPYISKILGVENIGKYNFASSIISYFILLAGLGISAYAIREGSKIRDEKDCVNSFASEVFSINILSTIVSYIALLTVVILSSKLYDYKNLIFILSIQIGFQTIGVEWIYSIYEDYAYITVRSFFFQLLSLALMFILVKTGDDVSIYAVITVISSVGSNLLNFFHAKKYTKLRLTAKIPWAKHMKPILVLFAMALTVTLYVSSDITILGFIKTDKEVGVYSVSVKIYTVVKKLLSSILVVSIPRLSLYLGKKDFDKFNNTARDIYLTLITAMIPAMVGLVLLRKEVVLILSDSSYISATFSLSILCIALFFCMGAWFWGQCILVPGKMEGIVFKATVVSAVTNVLLNIFLIPIGAEIAAAITTVIAEGVAFFWCRAEGRKIANISNLNSTVLKTIIGSLVMAIFIIPLLMLNKGTAFTFCSSVIIGVTTYVSSQMIMKNEVVIPLFTKIMMRKK